MGRRMSRRMSRRMGSKCSGLLGSRCWNDSAHPWDFHTCFGMQTLQALQALQACRTPYSSSDKAGPRSLSPCSLSPRAWYAQPEPMSQLSSTALLRGGERTMKSEGGPGRRQRHPGNFSVAMGFFSKACTRTPRTETNEPPTSYFWRNFLTDTAVIIRHLASGT